MEELLQFINNKENMDIHPVLRSGIVHYELVRIHPFVDGNGRVARALSTLLLFLEGYDIRKFFSLEEYFDSDALDYYKALQSVARNQGDLSVWLEYFTKGLSIELSKRGYQVTGIDFSEIAIEWAKDNAKKISAEVNFMLAELTDLSCFEDGAFDVVYDGNCLHCIIGQYRKSAIQEVRRVLKPNGIFFVSSLCLTNTLADFPREFDQDSHVLFESGIPYRQIQIPEALESELKDAGFEVLKKHIRSDSPFGHINIHLRRTQ
jgi:SAM-dependent methyltransferase